jgi:hypothetical protein
VVRSFKVSVATPDQIFALYLPLVVR